MLLIKLTSAFKQFKGFTIAELLIALVILGVIATFTIPKVLTAQQGGKYNAIAKEAASMISGAQQAAIIAGAHTIATRPEDFTNYLNYVKVTTTTIDSHYGDTTTSCNTKLCILLHNGGILQFDGPEYGGNATTNAIMFLVDPDGKVTETAQPMVQGKASCFFYIIQAA